MAVSTASGAIHSGGLLHTFSKVGGIARNTFFESIRQPVFGVIMAVAFALIVLSPFTTFFTLMESPKLIKDMGLATILLAGVLLAGFSAGNVIAEEMENKTAMTVLSKPVGRVEFILGKYLGVVMSLLLAGYVLSIVLILTVAGGAFEADLQVVQRWVVAANFGAAVLTLIGGVLANYYFGRPFSSTAVGLAGGFFTLALVVFLLWRPPPEMVNVYVKIDPQLALACALVVCALLVLGAVSVAASTRLNVVMNLALCGGVLLLGLMSDYVFGQHIATSPWARVAYAIVPNLQVFWVGQALTVGKVVPYGYFLTAGAYALIYIAAMMFLASFLFQNREVS